MTDLFRLPIVGVLSRWRHTRRVLQSVLLLVALLIVVHGLSGPQVAPRNAATVLTWVHYRGLLVLGLLAIGNLFCTACPMILTRDAARRVIYPRLRWPRRLRGKWLALVLFAAVLFAYELFDLWALPRATAWLVIGYFAAALIVDVLFTGASFCKYVCPVGQFSFAASLLSPTELQVRSLSTCRTCHTADCIKGRPAVGPATVPAGRPSSPALRGCELGLFLPLKAGNMDCTLCLDCVRACPHDNIGLMTRTPGAELLETRRRSGVGRFPRRPDLAALVVVFTFGAMLNAFAMTAPAAGVERQIAAVLGIPYGAEASRRPPHEAAVLGAAFAGTLVLTPLILLTAAAALTRAVSAADARPLHEVVIRSSYALLPLGFGIWLGHYGFHLLTGALTAVPVVQSAAADLSGRILLGEPLWRWAGMQPGSVYPLQLGFLLLGGAGSLGLALGISRRDYPARALAAAASWIVLVLVLTAASAWILAQPMEMRGVGFGG